MEISRAQRAIRLAMQLEGYEEAWQPNFDVPSLNRPRVRPLQLPGEGKFAAVLILFFERNDEVRFILTRRRQDMSQHPGQIAFPGGKCDPGETPVETALRETAEEVNADADSISVFGKLSNVYIPPSDFTVTPIVGWNSGSPEFAGAEYEVAEIIEVDLQQILDPETLVFGNVETWNKEDPSNPRIVQAPFYQVGHHQVWGATALMIDELVDRIRKVIDQDEV